jgi:hypothetical protein
LAALLLAELAELETVLAAPAALEVLLSLLPLLLAALEVLLLPFAVPLPLLPPPFVTVNLLQSS